MKPMLASPAPEDIRFPVLASPKIDGVRCLIKDGTAVSRSLKPIRNQYVQEVIGHHSYSGLDGELVVGLPTGQDCMQRTTSGVMSTSGIPDFTYWVFDIFPNIPTAPVATETFRRRLGRVEDFCMLQRVDSRIKVVPHMMVDNQAQLESYEQFVLGEGYEGVMLRDPEGPYKQGRSTAKEGWLLKLKRFVDSEAVVCGVEELMHNDNVATKNALGHTERSTHKENLRNGGVLGALVVRDLKTNVVFSIGSGFDAGQRRGLWHRRDKLVGKIVTYKHFANAGVKDAPRFPVFKGFRSEDDL